MAETAADSKNLSLALKPICPIVMNELRELEWRKKSLVYSILSVKIRELGLLFAQIQEDDQNGQFLDCFASNYEELLSVLTTQCAAFELTTAQRVQSQASTAAAAVDVVTQKHQ